MFIDFWIYLIYWLTKGLDLIAPEWYLPEAMMTAVNTGFEVMWFFNEVFPIHVIVEILLLLISYELSIMLIRLIIGLIALIRGAGKPEI